MQLQLTVAHADLLLFEIVQPFSFQFKAELGGNGYRNILLYTVDLDMTGWLHLYYELNIQYILQKNEWIMNLKMNSFAGDYIPASLKQDFILSLARAF